LGPNHAATASTLNNLGSLLQSTGQLAEAERLERRALRIFEEKLGSESMELATACSNMADLLWTKGDRVSAAAFYRRAMSIDESVYGPEDPDVAGDLANLGMLLKESGQRASAQVYFRRALTIYEKALGPDSPLERWTCARASRPRLIHDSFHRQADVLAHHCARCRASARNPPDHGIVERRFTRHEHRHRLELRNQNDT
jgi:tetratricopeptide (TPR) repeat protein